MSRKNDFVLQPLREKLNRNNPLTRIRRLEARTKLQPSARVGSLAELSQATGDMIVIGTLKIVDPATGEAVVVLSGQEEENIGTDVTIDRGGTWITNQQAAFGFEDTNGNRFNLYLYSDGDDNLVIFNDLAGKGIRQTVTLTDDSAPTMDWREDPSNANAAQFSLALGTNGTNWTVGGGQNVIWAGANGKETVFNEGGFDINLRVEGDTDPNLLNLDGGLSAAGIGTTPSSDYVLSVGGSVNVPAGSNYYINGAPVTALTELHHGTATTDTGTLINIYPPGNIPSGYDTLMLRVSLRADRAATAEGALLELNAQTSSDYSNYVMWHNFDNNFNDQAQSSSDTTSRPAILFANAANSPTNEFACYEIWFYNVSSTTKNKTWQVRGFQRASTANTQFFIYDSVGSWHPTTPAAITSIGIETQNGSNWIAGCEWWLYGM